MIGKGRFRLLTTNISGSDVPNVGQVRFDAMLLRSCGCRLAWHRVRRRFIVYRDRGRHVCPQTYCDLDRKCWPLHDALLPIVLDTVRWADAQMAQDPEVLADIVERRQAERSKKETHDFIEERFSDFWADVKRTKAILMNGKPDKQYFDFGAQRAG